MESRDYNIGRFTENVRFMRPERTTTDSGARDTIYTQHACVLAEVTDIQSQPEQIQQALAEEQTLLVKCWTVAGVTTEFRAVYDGETYDVVKIEKKLRGISYYYLRKTDL